MNVRADRGKREGGEGQTRDGLINCLKFIVILSSTISVHRL